MAVVVVSPRRACPGVALSPDPDDELLAVLYLGTEYGVLSRASISVTHNSVCVCVCVRRGRFSPILDRPPLSPLMRGRRSFCHPPSCPRRSGSSRNAEDCFAV